MPINRRPPSKIVIFDNYLVREDTLVTIRHKTTFLDNIKNKLLKVIRKCFHHLR